MCFAIGNTETFVLTMEENAFREDCLAGIVLAGAAEWALLIVYSLILIAALRSQELLVQP